MHGQQNIDSFATYLREHRLAEERHIPYLAGWVQRYLRLPVGAQLRDEDRLRLYADRLAADARLTDWQRRQAESGVRLYWQWRDDSGQDNGTCPTALPVQSTTLVQASRFAAEERRFLSPRGFLRPVDG